MTRHNHWDIARRAKTMGMKTDVTLDPTLITPRVKNSIKKQLRAGAITMGWESQAAKLAERLVVKFELPVARYTRGGIHVGTASRSTKSRLLEIVNADWTAMLLDSPQYAKASYHGTRYAKHIDSLNSSESKDFYVSFFDPAFAQQAQQVMGSLLTEDDRSRIELALAVLDSSEPIHITTIQ